MSFLFKLTKYHLVDMWRSWLVPKDSGSVDMALCNTSQRPLFLELVLTQCKYSVESKNANYLSWIQKRNVQMEALVMTVDSKMTVEDFRTLLLVNTSHLMSIKISFMLLEEGEQYGPKGRRRHHPLSTEMEESFLSFINSCRHLKTGELRQVGDETLSMVKPEVFGYMASLLLYDQFDDDHFLGPKGHETVDARFLLTSKGIDYLSQVCHKLVHLHIEYDTRLFYMEPDFLKTIYKSEDLVKLIRSNGELRKIELGIEGLKYRVTRPDFVRAVAETCTRLENLTVFDGLDIDLLALADLIVAAPRVTSVQFVEPVWEAELCREFQYRNSEAQRAPEQLRPYVTGDNFKMVSINHVGTMGAPSSGRDYNRPTEELIYTAMRPRKDIHKLQTFFSKVTGFHQIMLIFLSYKASKVDSAGSMTTSVVNTECEWSSDVTDEDLQMIAVKNPDLIDLQILSCGKAFTTDVFHTLFFRCKELKHLEFGRCRHLTNDDLLTIFSIPNSLHRVFITDHKTFDMITAREIVETCPCLLELVTENCKRIKKGEVRVGKCVIKSSFPVSKLNY